MAFSPNIFPFIFVAFQRKLKKNLNIKSHENILRFGIWLECNKKSVKTNKNDVKDLPLSPGNGNIITYGEGKKDPHELLPFHLAFRIVE